MLDYLFCILNAVKMVENMLIIIHTQVVRLSPGRAQSFVVFIIRNSILNNHYRTYSGKSPAYTFFHRLKHISTHTTSDLALSAIFIIIENQALA